MTFVEELIIALEDPRVREAVVGQVLSMARHDERFKERIGELAVHYVDEANARLAKLVEEAAEDQPLPVIDQTAIYHEGVTEG